MTVPAQKTQTEFLLNQIRHSFAAGYSTQAKDACLELLEADPDCDEAYMHLGLLYAQQDKLEEACECFQRAIGINDKETVYFALLSGVYLDLGLIGLAVQAALNAIEHSPKDFRGFYHLGCAFACDQKYDRGLEALNKAYDLNAQDVETLKALASCWAKKENLKKAAQYYKKVLKIKPKDPEILTLLGSLYAQEKPDKAKKYFRKALAQNAQYFDAHNHLIAMEYRRNINKRSSGELHVECDDLALDQLLNELGRVVQKAGGRFHPDLILRAQNNDLSFVLRENISPHSHIISVPQPCLVPTKFMNLKVQGNAFICNPDVEKLTLVQQDLAHLMVEIFNATNKLSDHKTTYPWLKYKANADALLVLSKARSLNKNLTIQTHYVEQKEDTLSEEDFIVWSFLKSRVLGEGDDKQSIETDYLMPMLDYLNHSYAGSPYVFDKDPTGDVRINLKQPILRSSECFASYGICDAIDTYFNYGFVDEHVPFVRSIPTKIDLGKRADVHIHSYRRPKKALAQLNADMQDLENFMPDIWEDEAGEMHVSHILIPSLSKPNALRRVLSHAIALKTDQNISSRALYDLVFKAEKQILDANVVFYKDVTNKVQNMQIAETLVEEITSIANLQLTKLHKYGHPGTLG